MKKVISLILVLAMTCVLFIVPAYAHETEEAVTPYGLACPRTNCSGTVSNYEVRTTTVWDGNVSGCTNNPFTHQHGHYYLFTHKKCNVCGLDEVIKREYITVCQYE